MNECQEVFAGDQIYAEKWHWQMCKLGRAGFRVGLKLQPQFHPPPPSKFCSNVKAWNFRLLREVSRKKHNLIGCCSVPWLWTKPRKYWSCSSLKCVRCLECGFLFWYRFEYLDKIESAGAKPWLTRRLYFLLETRLLCSLLDLLNLRF